MSQDGCPRKGTTLSLRNGFVRPEIEKSKKILTVVVKQGQRGL